MEVGTFADKNAFLGEDLGSGKHIFYIVGRTPEDVKNQLLQLKMPFRTIAAYGMNSRHYLIIESVIPVKKKTIRRKKGDS